MLDILETGHRKQIRKKDSNRAKSKYLENFKIELNLQFNLLAKWPEKESFVRFTSTTKNLICTELKMLLFVFCN